MPVNKLGFLIHRIGLGDMANITYKDFSERISPKCESMLAFKIILLTSYRRVGPTSNINKKFPSLLRAVNGRTKKQI